MAIAQVKLQRISPRKARLVADLFRNKDVSEALLILKNTNKKASVLFEKLVNSATANAVNNHGLNAEKLYIAKVLVNEGPTLKRYQPRSRGRAFKIFKRTSHLLVEVLEKGGK